METTRGRNFRTAWLLRSFAAAVLFCSSGVALAATVGFSPSPKSAATNETFDMDIVGTGFTDPLAGGTFDISFDSNLVQINSVTVNTTVYEFLPDGGSLISPGLWGTVGFDTFGTAPTGDITIATVNLTALGTGTSNLTIVNSEFYDDTVNTLFPTLTPGVINPPVPVPAAVWLFGSGLVGFIGLARKKAA